MDTGIPDIAPVMGSVLENQSMGPQKVEDGDAEVEKLRHQVHEFTNKVDEVRLTSSKIL